MALDVSLDRDKMSAAEDFVMTLPSSLAAPFGAELPTADERGAAAQLREVVAAAQDDDGTLMLRSPTGESTPITLTPALAELLMSILRPLSRGDAIALVPISQMLTTQQAADILNVSRPYLIGLLEQGKIPHEKVGRHRRVKASDLFEFKARRDEARARALAELAAGDADLI